MVNTHVVSCIKLEVSELKVLYPPYISAFRVLCTPVHLWSIPFAVGMCSEASGFCCVADVEWHSRCMGAHKFVVCRIMSVTANTSDTCVPHCTHITKDGGFAPRDMTTRCQNEHDLDQGDTVVHGMLSGLLECTRSP